MTRTATRISPEGITLSDISQPQKDRFLFENCLREQCRQREGQVRRVRAESTPGVSEHQPGGSEPERGVVLAEGGGGGRCETGLDRETGATSGSTLLVTVRISHCAAVPPFICRGCVPRPQWVSETTDSTEPHEIPWFPTHTYLVTRKGHFTASPWHVEPLAPQLLHSGFTMK